MGTFKLEYSMVTPWLPTDAGHTVTAARDVIIQDVNECVYTGDDPTFKHQCYVADPAGGGHDADAVCTNVVMTDDNQGPGYTCSCPDGYDGNAFASAGAFERHLDGKRALQDLYDAEVRAEGEDESFDAWLVANRRCVVSPN